MFNGAVAGPVREASQPRRQGESILIEPDEDVAIRHVTDHLKTSYHDSRAPAGVEAAVATAYATFDHLPIRTYVAVLVERQARRILREHTG